MKRPRNSEADGHDDEKDAELIFDSLVDSSSSPRKLTRTYGRSSVKRATIEHDSSTKKSASTPRKATTIKKTLDKASVLNKEEQVRTAYEKEWENDVVDDAAVNELLRSSSSTPNATSIFGTPKLRRNTARVPQNGTRSSQTTSSRALRSHGEVIDEIATPSKRGKPVKGKKITNEGTSHDLLNQSDDELGGPMNLASDIDVLQSRDDTYLASPSKPSSSRLSTMEVLLGAASDIEEDLPKTPTRVRFRKSSITDGSPARARTIRVAQESKRDANAAGHKRTISDDEPLPGLPPAKRPRMVNDMPETLERSSKGHVAEKRVVNKLPMVTTDFDPKSISKRHVELLTTDVLNRLTGRVRLKLRGLEDEYDKVHTLMRETIVRAESNSVLIIGARSSAKTLLVETAIAAFEQSNPKEFLVVRLNGMVQTDDRVALREIARQLQPDADSEATVSQSDLMTALLGLLSHPADFGETDEPLSVLFVLEEFHRFTEQPRQTLLYNLFDIAQSKKAPICVLGLTYRVNAYEALEKRVKSRFSHRIVQLVLPTKVEDFTQLCLDALVIDMEQANCMEEDFAAYCRAWNLRVQESCLPQSPLGLTIRAIYDRSKDVQEFYIWCGTRVSHVTAEEPWLQVGTTEAATLVEGKLALIPGCSALEVALLVCAARLETKGRVTCNLKMVHGEYRTLAERTAVSQRSDGVSNVRIWG